jgi:sugar/nucleoside kinase (ribokinase family)
VGTEAVTAALQLGRRLGARTVLNAAPAPPPGSLDLNALLAATDVLVVNETEAELMAGERGEGGSGGWAGPAARLLGLGCRSVVITLGAAGAVVAQADRPGLVAVPAPQVQYFGVFISVRIRRIRTYISRLLDPDPDPLVRGTGMDLDPDPSIPKQK